jgi:hypothetical protein
MLPWEEAAQQAPQSSVMPWEEAAQSQQQPSIMQRIGNELQSKVAEGNQIANSNLNPVAKTIAYVGKVGAGTANDALSAMVPQAVKDLASGAVNKIEEVAGHLPGMQSYNNAVNNTMHGVDQAYHGFAQNHPNIAASAEGIGDIGQLAGNLAAAKGVGDTAVNAGKAVYNGIVDNPTIASRAAAGEVEQSAPAINQDELKPLNNPKNIKISKDEPNAVSNAIDEERQKAYGAAAASGAARTPQAVNGFLNDAINNEAFDPDTFTSASDKSALNLVNKLGDELNGHPMSIKRAQALDQDIATLKNGAFKKPDAPNQRLGYQYAAIQQALRDNIFNNPNPSTYIGNPEGWNALNEGNRLHSQYMKAKTVENLFQNGAEKAVPSTSIQTQFGGLAKKIRQAGKGQLGYTDEQVAAINRAAKTGVVEPLLRTMGSKLMGPLLGIFAGAPAGPIGEFLGMGAGHIMGEPFRMGATALRSGKVSDVLRAVVNDPYYNRLPASAVEDVGAAQAKPQGLLPPPDYRAPMTDDQIAAARAQINNPPQKTGGVPLGEQVGNPAPTAQTVVRDPNTGLLHTAIKEPVGTAAANEGYQALPWINQRQVDRIIPQYANNSISRAQALRAMARAGLSPRDADAILTSAYQSKIWRKQ